ncbi:hypothetical protein NA57DRAFT_55940 [Rhizodiscina lignyota]|uniref:Uncharacterized protein n=1 Tax=Rhizodiscina lignyota TaxID=1504668 RepID=A0A9P4IIP3_9PEZI|nr:hypothetical protein NA57DRAFT_55940 [Rhizodiscina lignyota]
MEPQKIESFLDLPAELRNAIYECYLHEISLRGTKHGNPRSLVLRTFGGDDSFMRQLFSPPMLRVNKQVSSELASIIFRQMTFNCRYTYTLGSAEYERSTHSTQESLYNGSSRQQTTLNSLKRAQQVSIDVVAFKGVQDDASYPGVVREILKRICEVVRISALSEYNEPLESRKKEAPSAKAIRPKIKGGPTKFQGDLLKSRDSHEPKEDPPKNRTIIIDLRDFFTRHVKEFSFPGNSGAPTQQDLLCSLIESIVEAKQKFRLDVTVRWNYPIPAANQAIAQWLEHHCATRGVEWEDYWTTLTGRIGRSGSASGTLT